MNSCLHLSQWVRGCQQALLKYFAARPFKYAVPNFRAGGGQLSILGDTFDRGRDTGRGVIFCASPAIERHQAGHEPGALTHFLRALEWPPHPYFRALNLCVMLRLQVQS